MSNTQIEMEAIYRSYEWLIREKLVQLDSIARSMFAEMGTFSVKKESSREYAQSKFIELAKQVAKEGDKDGVKKHRVQSGAEKHT